MLGLVFPFHTRHNYLPSVNKNIGVWELGSKPNTHVLTLHYQHGHVCLLRGTPVLSTVTGTGSMISKRWCYTFVTMTCKIHYHFRLVKVSFKINYSSKKNSTNISWYSQHLDLNETWCHGSLLFTDSETDTCTQLSTTAGRFLAFLTPSLSVPWFPHFLPSFPLPPCHYSLIVYKQYCPLSHMTLGLFSRHTTYSLRISKSHFLYLKYRWWHLFLSDALGLSEIGNQKYSSVHGKEHPHGGS